MDNPFAGLKQIRELDSPTDQAVHHQSDIEHKQKREALYAEYTPRVYEVLDQLIAAYRPGAWIKGSDSDHEYCCHCRWYAGPAETGHAHYGDHPVRRHIEIELEVNIQCDPTGFKVLYYDKLGKCAHTGLSQDDLVRGIQAVLA